MNIGFLLGFTTIPGLIIVLPISATFSPAFKPSVITQVATISAGAGFYRAGINFAAITYNKCHIYTLHLVNCLLRVPKQHFLFPSALNRTFTYSAVRDEVNVSYFQPMCLHQ